MSDSTKSITNLTSSRKRTHQSFLDESKENSDIQVTSSPLKSKKLSIEAIHSPCAKKLGTDITTPPSISKPSEDELPVSIADSTSSFKSSKNFSEDLKSTVNSSSLLNDKSGWSSSFKSSSALFKSKTLPTETENLFTKRANNFTISSQKTSFGNSYNKFNSNGFGWLNKNKKEDGDKKEEKPITNGFQITKPIKKDETIAFKASEKPLLIGKDKIEPNLKLVKTSTGEESEVCVLEINAKLFQFSTTKRDWEDLGRGILRVNDNRKFTEQRRNRHRRDIDIDKNVDLKRSSRLIMRGSGTLRVILNTCLYPDMMATKAGAKSVKISASHHETGQVVIYLINCKPPDCDDLIKTITHRLIELQNQRQQIIEQNSKEDKQPTKDLDYPEEGEINDSTDINSQTESSASNDVTSQVQLVGPEDGDLTDNSATNIVNTSFSSNDVNSQASRIKDNCNLTNETEGEESIS